MSLLLSLFFAANASQWTAPRPAPAEFKSSRYALTFKTPKGASYCPVRRGWNGSDNGTLLFLSPPARCGMPKGTSTNRAFTPNPLPMLTVSYRYAGYDRSKAPCRMVDRMKVMGAVRPVCETLSGGTVIRSVRASYTADIPLEVLVTMVSTPARLRKDMDAFRKVTGTLRSCSATLPGPRGDFMIGRGKPCPSGATWF